MGKYVTYVCLLISIFFIGLSVVNAKPLSSENSFYVAQVLDGEDSGDATCEGVLGDINDESSVAHLLQEIFDIMKIASPVLVLVFSILDFLGAVASQDKDRLIKAVKNTFIRVIVGLLVFTVPFLCDFLFELTGMYSTCGVQ